MTATTDLAALQAQQQQLDQELAAARTAVAAAEAERDAAIEARRREAAQHNIAQYDLAALRAATATAHRDLLLAIEADPVLSAYRAWLAAANWQYRRGQMTNYARTVLGQAQQDVMMPATRPLAEVIQQALEQAAQDSATTAEADLSIAEDAYVQGTAPSLP